MEFENFWIEVHVWMLYYNAHCNITLNLTTVDFDHYEKNNKELKLQIQTNRYLDYLLMPAYFMIPLLFRCRKQFIVLKIEFEFYVL